MRKYLICLLFPFLLNNLYAEEKKEEKKEIKRHSFSAEETLSVTDDALWNLAKAKYQYTLPRLEQLLESSFDYNKTDGKIKRDLFRVHHKLDYKVEKYYGFFDTDYQKDKVNYQILYFTFGLGTRIKFFKLDLGYGYKIVDKTPMVNVSSFSIGAERNINTKWKLGGSFSAKQPLKERPRKASLYSELTVKYKLVEHFNVVASYTKIREKPKDPNDSWEKFALRVGVNYEYEN
ncbi:MAG: DUF481 domain-containing protein [Nanoarchaeota archaeon]